MSDAIVGMWDMVTRQSPCLLGAYTLELLCPIEYYIYI